MFFNSKIAAHKELQISPLLLQWNLKYRQFVTLDIWLTKTRVTYENITEASDIGILKLSCF